MTNLPACGEHGFGRHVDVEINRDECGLQMLVLRSEEVNWAWLKPCVVRSSVASRCGIVPQQKLT